MARKKKSKRAESETPKKHPDWMRYCKEMKAYESYYLTRSNHVSCVGGTWPLDLTDPEDSTFVRGAAEYALKIHNEKRRVPLSVVAVIRANIRICGRNLYFVTFRASNGKVFETQVAQGSKGFEEVREFRPAIHYPRRAPLP